MKSKRKGNQGEREWRDKVNNALGTNYQRTPLSGGMDLKGDIRRAYGSKPSEIDEYHAEVKRNEKINIHKCMQQAMMDANSKIPYVAHRRNQGRWMVTMLGDDFLALMAKVDNLLNQ